MRGRDDDTSYRYINCGEEEKWIDRLKRELRRLVSQEDFLGFSTIAFAGKGSKDIVPIKYVQYSRTLIIFQKMSFPAEEFPPKTYIEIIKLLALYADSFYASHNDYFQLLNNMRRAQDRLTRLPHSVGRLADALDTFYMCIMSGKAAERKQSSVDREAIMPVADRVRKAYPEFKSNPFLAINSAAFDGLLNGVYKIDLGVPLPDYNSARIILGRVRELVLEGITSTGPDATYQVVSRFFGIAQTYINSHIDDLRERCKHKWPEY